jgi:hypothetical protein
VADGALRPFDSERIFEALLTLLSIACRDARANRVRDIDQQLARLQKELAEEEEGLAQAQLVVDADNASGDVDAGGDVE